MLPEPPALVPGRISVITAVHRDRGHYLAEARASLSGQDLPGGWQVEWLLQEDGDHPRFGDLFSSDAAVSYAANDRHFGPATTRNLALARATGVILLTLDEDDVFLASGLQSLVEPLLADPLLGWVAGQGADLPQQRERPTATRSTSAGLAGSVGPGAVFEAWSSCGVFPVLANHVAYRTAIVRQAGGWPALPRSEDAALLLGVSGRHPGLVLRQAVLGYRRHPLQNTAQSWSQRNRADAQRLMVAAHRPTASVAAPPVH